MLILIIVVFLIVSCDEQNINELWNNPVYQEKIVNLDNKSDNLMIINSDVVDMFPEYKKVQETHNPSILTNIEKSLLFYMCSNLIYFVPYDLNDSNVGKPNLYHQAVQGLFEEYNSTYETTYETGKYISSYLTFQCMSGYPIYLNQLKEMYIDSFSNPEKVIYIKESFNINSYNIFEIKNPPPPDELIESYFASKLLDEIEFKVYEGEMSIRTNTATKMFNVNEMPRTIEELKEEVKILRYKKVDEKEETQEEIEFVEEFVETQKEETNLELIKKEVRQEIKQEVQQNIQRSEETSQQYDFPELRKNKEELILISQYSPKFQKAISSYDKIGFKTEDRSLTFVISKGLITKIEDGINNVDFTITTTTKNAINMFDMGMSGNTKGVLSIVKELDIPFSVKMRILKNVVS